MTKNQNNKKIELVVQSNSLVEAQYKLSSFSQLLLRKMISMIKPTDTHFKKSFYRISVSEIAELTGRRIDSLYSDIKRSGDQLLKTVVSIQKTKENMIRSTWVASIEHHAGEGWFEFEFSSKLESELLKLKDKFTKYYLKNVSKLNSQYSIRLYELLTQYMTVHFRRIDLLDLRAMLGIDKQYKQFFDFKRKVLNKAKKEICENTDISFSWEPFKTGRRVTAIDFYIYKNKKEKEGDELSEDIINLIPKEFFDSVSELCKEIMSKKGHSCLIWILEYVNSKKEHRNYGGYIRFAYENKLYEKFLEQQRLEEKYLADQEALAESKKQERAKEEHTYQQEQERKTYLHELINSLSEDETEELNQLALEAIKNSALTDKGGKAILDRYEKFIHLNQHKKANNCLYFHKIGLIEEYKAKKEKQLKE